jgi:hypothetical protein
MAPTSFRISCLRHAIPLNAADGLGDKLSAVSAGLRTRRLTPGLLLTPSRPETNTAGNEWY